MSGGDGTVLGELTALRASATAAASHENAKGDAIGVSWQNGAIAGLEASRSLVGEALLVLRERHDRLVKDGYLATAKGYADAIDLLWGGR